MNTEQNKTYGYARVSTKDQHEDRQVLALTECDVAVRNIYVDKQSGKRISIVRNISAL